jgi:hypothetical protein
MFVAEIRKSNEIRCAMYAALKYSTVGSDGDQWKNIEIKIILTTRTYISFPVTRARRKGRRI